MPYGTAMQWELTESDSGCALSDGNDTYEDLGLVAKCSGRYRYNCSSSSRTIINLCIVGELTYWPQA